MIANSLYKLSKIKQLTFTNCNLLVKNSKFHQYSKVTFKIRPSCYTECLYYRNNGSWDLRNWHLLHLKRNKWAFIQIKKICRWTLFDYGNVVDHPNIHIEIISTRTAQWFWYLASIKPLLITYIGNNDISLNIDQLNLRLYLIHGFKPF